MFKKNFWDGIYVFTVYKYKLFNILHTSKFNVIIAIAARNKLKFIA